MVSTQNNGTTMRRWDYVRVNKICGYIIGGKASTTKSNTRGGGQRLRGRGELQTPNFEGMDTEQKISANLFKSARGTPSRANPPQKLEQF